MSEISTSSIRSASSIRPLSSIRLISPSDETFIQTVAHTTVEEVDDAVARGAHAQKTWAAFAPLERANALRRFAAAVGEANEELAQLEVLNSGHPITQARWEAGHVRDVLTYYSAAPERMLGSQIPVAGGIDITFLEPLGVVGVIVPWNFPMTIASWGFAPALAAGNAVVLKPAEWTPLTALRLGELALEAGLPEGLFQVLPGTGSVVGERFVSHPDVRKIVFTGSTETGQARDGRLRGPSQGGHPRARRQEREHRVRRLRPGAGRGIRPLQRLRKRRTGLLRALPNTRGAVGAGEVPAISRAGGAGVPGGGARRRGHRDGAARLRRAPREGAVVRARRPAGRVPRQCSGWRGVLVRAHGAAARLAHRSRGHRGDLRAGRERPAVRRRGRRDRARERLDLRAERLDLDPRCGPRHPRRPGRRERQPQREFALGACATRPRSAVSSRAAWVASWGRMRRPPSPRPRTSSSPPTDRKH